MTNKLRKDFLAGLSAHEQLALVEITWLGAGVLAILAGEKTIGVPVALATFFVAVPHAGLAIFEKYRTKKQTAGDSN